MATYPRLPLDPSVYNFGPEELAFFKAETGIQDDNELRIHILQVQAEAYAVYPHLCIRNLTFTKLKLSNNPAYDAILRLGKERKGALFLDLGCCFGTDVRKAIIDGFPQENIIASDLRKEFWELGRKLFKKSPDTFPICFLPGDIFDPSFLSPDASPAPTSLVPDLGPLPCLSKLTSLTPLQHRISIIHTAAFFHLFNETQQRDLAHLLATLLSPLPGSMIVGWQIGLPDLDEYHTGGLRDPTSGRARFTHSPSSWKRLWVGSDGVFKPHDVLVSATTKEVELRRPVYTDDEVSEVLTRNHLLTWSITRV